MSRDLADDGIVCSRYIESTKAMDRLSSKNDPSLARHSSKRYRESESTFNGRRVYRLSFPLDYLLMIELVACLRSGCAEFGMWLS